MVEFPHSHCQEFRITGSLFQSSCIRRSLLASNSFNSYTSASNVLGSFSTWIRLQSSFIRNVSSGVMALHLRMKESLSYARLNPVFNGKLIVLSPRKARQTSAIRAARRIWRTGQGIVPREGSRVGFADSCVVYCIDPIPIGAVPYHEVSLNTEDRLRHRHKSPQATLSGPVPVTIPVFVAQASSATNDSDPERCGRTRP